MPLSSSAVGRCAQLAHNQLNHFMLGKLYLFQIDLICFLSLNRNKELVLVKALPLLWVTLYSILPTMEVPYIPMLLITLQKNCSVISES